MTTYTQEDRLEAEQHHLRLLVERLVREGYSEQEITRAVDRAASPQRKAA